MALAGLGLAATGGCATDTTGGSAPSTSVITSTTMIAGAGVLGNQRRPDESCAAEPAPAEGGPHRVDNAEGVAPPTVEVPADPQRIVVLAVDQLDALCALGLQSRIVAAAAQPSYLGTVIHDLPTVGSPDAPDLAAIRGAEPDLILGSVAASADLYPQLAEIAPTVFTTAAGARWQGELRTVAAATGRAGAADGLLDGFAEAARQLAAKADTAHYQASIVQFTDDGVRIFGAVNFPGSVLKEAGLDRPPAQRFTDRPFIEVDTADLDGADFSAADADIVYVSFATATARERAPRIFDSDAWRALSANADNRVFVVNNEVWQAGQNLVAARGILDDLQWVNAPIN
ncbi:Fe3+-citrate ABC transporter substrate-binding protein [Mycolicibacillus trivialis]|uniref:Fe3+-citrate ABC transporter substrate-binding protein n=1 Tax=Mycolicibacillus trivialis TaxID=1798 RepID=A0A1X2EGJ9_9MYCO|nr:Fe3+-citrate ABC transporter substrate-binding protein [Mycolicibacillus trivialis]